MIIEKDPQKTIKLVDVGCGSGELLKMIAQNINRDLPRLNIELYGFDISDSKVQGANFFTNCIQKLKSVDPSTPWENRLKQIASADSWPYEEKSVDILISNQVLEHVNNLPKFFTESARILNDKGLSINLFPLRSCWMEYHLKVPFVHWLAPHAHMVGYIKIMSILGLGTWGRFKKTNQTISLNEFSKMNRDFIAFDTNYVDEFGIEALCKLTRMRPSYSLTGNMYLNKIRALAGRPLRPPSAESNSIVSAFFFKILKRIHIVTLVLTKDNLYENRGFHTA